MANTRFRGPLGFNRTNQAFDSAPLELVDQLAVLSGQDELLRMQGWASDFIQHTGPPGTATATAGGWISTVVGTGSSAVNSALGGVLQLTTTAAVNDTVGLQMQGAQFAYVLGKKLWFGCRIADSDLTNGSSFVGLAIQDASLIASFPTDGFFFERAATETDRDFHARKTGTSTERLGVDGTVALVANAFHEYAFQVDSSGNIRVFYDGVENTSAFIAAGNANIPSGTVLTPSIAVLTATTAVNVQVDWLLVAQER